MRTFVRVIYSKISKRVLEWRNLEHDELHDRPWHALKEGELFVDVAAQQWDEWRTGDVPMFQVVSEHLASIVGPAGKLRHFHVVHPEDGIVDRLSVDPIYEVPTIDGHSLVEIEP